MFPTPKKGTREPPGEPATRLEFPHVELDLAGGIDQMVQNFWSFLGKRTKKTAGVSAAARCPSPSMKEASLRLVNCGELRLWLKVIYTQYIPKLVQLYTQDIRYELRICTKQSKIGP